MAEPTLSDIRALAKRGGCYIVEKKDEKGPLYILYRATGSRGSRIGTKRDLKLLALLVKKAIQANSN